MPDRKKHAFPTRQYPYKKEHEITKEDLEIKNFSIKPSIFFDGNDKILSEPKSHVMRFIVGLDAHPRPLEFEEIKNLNDSFADLILKKGLNPLTLNEILEILDGLNDEEVLPDQSSFLAADGGQIIWTESTSNLNRQFRFVISRSGNNNESQILISSSTLLDSKEQFLQLISWDKIKGAYNFYERRGESWFWAGDSFHALQAPSRGKGPFDSHVNGAIVMKELKLPWVHWHSMTASINDDVLSPDDELRQEKLWLNKSGGQDFEIQIVKPAIIKWNNSRFHKMIESDGTFKDCNKFFRQVITTTTINIVTTKEESKSIVEESRVRIPETFFFNKDVFMDEIGLEPSISPVHFKGKHYLESLIDFDFHVGDGSFKFKGDTHFAFLIPEPSFEDVNLISLMIEKGIVTKKFIASLLMVDFANPIYSMKRGQLLKYFPEKDSIHNNSVELNFLVKIENSPESKIQETSEFLFLSNYNLGDDEWKSEFEKRIENYFTRLHILLERKEGFYDLTRLAESRRREFRKTDLAEFRLTTPITNISDSAELLQLTEGATIITK